MSPHLSLMLRHELQLNWRMTLARVPAKMQVAGVVGLLLMMHLIALPFPFMLWEAPEIPEIDILAGVTALGFGLLAIMVPTALIGTVRLVYARGDMDLLLSSPVRPEAIVIGRLAAIAFGLFTLAGLFTLPFANLMAVFGYPRFLLAYVVLVCVTLLATSLGLVVAHALFRTIGPRHTRLVAQIVAGLLGLTVLLLANLHNILPKSAQDQAAQTLGELMAQLPSVDSWVWLPARAALGEPLPFIVGVLFCAGFFLLTVFTLSDRLIENAKAAEGTTGSRAGSTRSRRQWLKPGSAVRTIIWRKEWLLVARDPWVATQIGQQLLMCLPCILLVWNATSASAAAWLAVIFVSGQLAGSLAWLAVSTDDAPDLLATAPVPYGQILIAKLQAALVPAAILTAVPIVVAAMMDIWLGATLAVCSLGGMTSCGLLHIRYPSRGKRSELASRGSSNRLLGMIELLIVLLWVVAGLLMLTLGAWGLLAVAVLAFGTLMLARGCLRTLG